MVGRRVRLGAAASVAALALTAAIALAAPGDLDPAFSQDGRVQINFGGDERTALPIGMALQPDGKLVVAGSTTNAINSGDESSWAISRLLPDGSPDPSFSGDGSVVYGLGPTGDAYAVAIQPDGKILIAGSGGATTGSKFTVMRLNSDGSLDTGFGPPTSPAVAPIDLDPAYNEYATALALQSDGKILVAGYMNLIGGTEAGFARLTPDGALDTSFDDDGIQTLDPGRFNVVQDFAIDPNGRIDAAITTGFQPTSAQQQNLVVARLRPDGKVDTGFGDAGFAQPDLGGFDVANAIALQPDGRIIVAGTTGAAAGAKTSVAVARLESSGATDLTFDGDGKLTLNVGGPIQEAFGAAALASGKIVITGEGGNNSDLIVTRLNPDGSVDPGFGAGGTQAADFTGTESGGRTLIQPDGAVIVSGGTTNGNDIAVARVLGDPPDQGGGPAPPGEPEPPSTADTCRGKTVTIPGSDQRDKLKGTPGDDVILAAGGNDKVKGGGGADLICGGDGNDKVSGGPGADTLLGDDGKDRLQGGGGPDRLLGGAGNDFLNGGGGKNVVRGGPGHDEQKP